MGIFDKLKTVLNDVIQPPAGLVVEPKQKPKTQRTVKPKTAANTKPLAKSKKSTKKKITENPEKALATKRGEPWVDILNINLDPNNPGNGAIELDWNDIFVARLIKAGYQGKTDQDIVDNWFRAVCRNVVMETFEQEQADPEKRSFNTNRRDLGNGRTEVS